MIRLFDYWWKQLNGPQITAVMSAAFQYARSQISTFTDYIRTWSLETSNDSHLTLLGTLMGLARPVMTQEAIKNFWFTDGESKSEEPGEYHGFSDSTYRVPADAPGAGGRFTDLYSSEEQMEDVYLPAVYWRNLLRLIGQSEGEGGSLKLVDDVVHWFYTQYRPQIIPDYTIEIEQLGDDAHAIGDLNLHIGKLTYWMEYAPFIYAALETLANSYYMPVPLLHVIFNYASGIWEPIDTDYIVQMWTETVEIDEDQGIGYIPLTETELTQMWEAAQTFEEPDDPIRVPITTLELSSMWDGTYGT